MQRITLTIEPDMEAEIDELKRTEFYDKPYAEVYRHLIELGLAAKKTA